MRIPSNFQVCIQFGGTGFFALRPDRARRGVYLCVRVTSERVPPLSSLSQGLPSLRFLFRRSERRFLRRFRGQFLACRESKQFHFFANSSSPRRTATDREICFSPAQAATKRKRIKRRRANGNFFCCRDLLETHYGEKFARAKPEH